MAKNSDSPQGALELLILKALAKGPNHGFGISQLVRDGSGGLLTLEEGSLYPALHRMERELLLRSEWQVTESGRRARLYSLTPAGRKRLSEVTERWSNLTRGINRFLRYA